ncbi:FlgD immunoglobulin-like domain containing protein [Nocardioides sp. MAHUQ-72]|uniref:FlgD immunoglobulin-like domain containing protein n=1 Tax=unclassified Nocardioides TaxID=2615069 RepID=UPI0036072C49
MRVNRAVLAAALAVGLATPAAAATQDPHVSKRNALGGQVHRLALGSADEVGPQLAQRAEEATTGAPAAAAISSTPVITEPTPGATVSGAITLAATSGDTSVRFGLTSYPWTQSVPVVDGVASTTFETFGLNGPQQLTAQDCDATGCSASTAAVDVTVDNAPVAIVQPSDNATVGTSVSVMATAPGGAVRFLLDGAPIAQATSAPYTTTIDTSALAQGAHTVSAIACSTDLARCDASRPDQVVIDVRNRLAPVITSAAPSTFSPNGDGRKDTTEVSYRLDSAQSVAWRVLNRSGQTVRGPVELGTLGAGSHAWKFNGRNDAGSVLGDGAYTVRLETTRTVGGTEVSGSAERTVEIDRTAPLARRMRATPRTFYPVKDGYRDKATVKTDLSEDVQSLRAEVVDARGRRVRTIDSGAQRRGTRTLVWDGRSNSGARVTAGRYGVRLTLRDAAGNQTVTDSKSLVVSDKRLVKRSAVKTMAPKSNLAGHVIGGCSQIWYPAKKNWPGSLSYLSNYEVCYDPTDTQLLAFTRHAIKLPAAVEYGKVRVDTYGARSVPGYPDIGLVFYETRSGDISEQGGILRASQRWHSGDAVRADGFVSRKHLFRWWAGTSNSNFYDVKSFRVSYSYYVLD